MKYLIDVLLDEDGEISIHRAATEIEAESEAKAHEQAIAQFRQLYPQASIAVATVDTTRH
jgi:hypothetical protein